MQGEGAGDRRGVPSASGGTSSSPSSSMKRAPCSPSSPGWNMNSTSAGELAGAGRRAGGRRRRASPCGCRARRRASCPRRSTRTRARCPRQRQRVHVAAQQHRRTRLAAGEQGGDPARRLVHGHVEGQRFDRRQDLLLGDRQVVADLRPAMQRAAQLDARASAPAPRRAARDVDPLTRSCSSSALMRSIGATSARRRPVEAARRIRRRPATGGHTMPAGMYGADPDQLGALGSKLVAQNEPIAEIQSVVLTTLAGTTWQGPARDKFEADWNDQFNPALNALKDAFTAAGNECTQRRASLAQVMGVVASALRTATGRPHRRRSTEPSTPRWPTLTVQALEFTVEPFVEGHPGPHVRRRRRRRVARRRRRVRPVRLDVPGADDGDARHRRRRRPGGLRQRGDARVAARARTWTTGRRRRDERPAAARRRQPVVDAVGATLVARRAARGQRRPARLGGRGRRRRAHAAAARRPRPADRRRRGRARRPPAASSAARTSSGPCGCSTSAAPSCCARPSRRSPTAWASAASPSTTTSTRSSMTA